jgi:2-polyprenyl-3-methyl-5-hydroxy-6-metoxy-1,4-benzoquinol methylase
MGRAPTGARLELESNPRFAFGANWARFLGTLNEERIRAAQSALQAMLGFESLEGLRFLDIGSGSGLMSLAARRMGASVHSFDFDARSVACTRELQQRFFPSDAHWRIEQGSVLDRAYLERLGIFDVVYSWGVLHHTGAMWLALENAARCVTPGGTLFIAIYNDQGAKSRVWWLIKRGYISLPRLCRAPYATLFRLLTGTASLLKHTLRLRPQVALAPWLRDRRERGMSARFDWIDWIGGFPFEFASFETLQAHLESRGFTLSNARPTTGWGCHELVFRRGRCAE